jgi:alanine racemase
MAEDRSEDRNRRPRIADVAREAGVSKAAVSFAFNSPDRLNPDTAARILEIAAELGYRPHPVARMLSQGQTLTIGVLAPQALSVTFSNPFFGAFSEGVAAAAERRGYALHFVSPVQGSLALAASRATVDGFVALGLSEEHPEVEQIRRAGLPIVVVDANPYPDQSSVRIDDETGARQAADHLLSLGHRCVVVVAVAEPGLPPTDPGGVMGRRLLGYRCAFRDAGIDLPDRHVVHGPASVAGGAEAMATAWSRGVAPTAVLAMSDASAVGVIRAARERGLSVPVDLSVVGFDDIDLALFTDPPLTTVHQPARRKGEEAAMLLLDAIADPSTRPEHRMLETHLVVRASTAPARPPDA